VAEFQSELDPLSAIRNAGSEVFHVGLVVEDVEHAMTELHTLLGTAWGRVQNHSAVRQTPEGPRRFQSVFAMSIDTPPFWELIGRQDGSPWARLGFNHVGIWCDDFDEAAALRTAAGWQWESGKYFQGPDGVRYELVPRGLYEPRLARYRAGGQFFEEQS
jgi:catechol 2,3-dioxygenase-like lactoylglutathione lyase family enzyme